MSERALVDRLAVLPTLTDIPRPQLEWLAARGVVRSFADGGILYSAEQPGGVAFSDDDPDPGLVIVLAGRLSVRRVERSGVSREIRGLTPGSVSGRLPYSRLTTSAGYVVADGPAEILLIGASLVPDMTKVCYEFTARCVHEMLDRARAFRTDDLQQEKMTSLGRLSAGIAHELNNPSSAIVGSAREMDTCRLELAAAARALGALVLAADQLAAVTALEDAAARPLEQPLSALARADREDMFDEWLAERDISGVSADRLAQTGLAIEDLQRAEAALGAGNLAIALPYVATAAAAGRLAAEIDNAARRIHSVVAAVKKHTHMDRAPAAEPLRLDLHLKDTMTLVASRAGAKSISLTLMIQPDLPLVHGAAGELNQVWLNLIDNAIDAAPDGGHVAVAATYERHAVMVRVTDDGGGIADEHLARIFDPFFTTKPVGQGAGLGLDIVRTVVTKHRGAVEVESTPGRTEFRVCLPAAKA